MKINRVTITGADDLTNISDLVEITNKFPFVEWGILFSKNKEGQYRYPKKEWINQVTKAGIPLSAHLCGAYTRDIFEKYDTSFLKKLKGNWKRVQLNYNFKNQGDYSQCCNVAQMLQEVNDKNYIFQFNKSNENFIKGLVHVEVTNWDILFDSSGGRGTQIKILQEPFKNIYTGYSGGIDPECHLF